MGQISYGVYLWHFPIFLWLTAVVVGLGGIGLLLVRLGVTLAIAVVSFLVIEQPNRRRKVPDWAVRTLAPVGAGAAIVALIGAAAVTSAGIPAASAVHRPTQLEGSALICSVPLADRGDYGLAPMSSAKAAVAQPKWLAARRLKWSGSSQITSHTCPPRRVMIIGDSIAFSLGLAAMIGEQQNGVELANAAILGCAFTTHGELRSSDVWEQQPQGCAGALEHWATIERAFHPQVVVVELGYQR
jgi:hypothetical protein